MALASVNFFSISLMKNVSVNVIIPVDKYNHSGKVEAQKKPFKTLYLLHGIYGDYTDWVNNTRILSWASKKNLAVVMPSGDNHFYVDGPAKYGYDYSRFISEELVKITRAMFPLSDKREDTFIGGLSMGGYGAVINGLKYNNVFSRVIALSALFETDSIQNSTNDVQEMNGRRDYFESVFGNLDRLKGSDRDYTELIRKLKEEKADIPKFYVACGTEDFLLEHSRRFVDFAIDNEMDVTYNESAGAHTWDFWDEYIRKAIDWLPLGEGKEGISSGNVK